MGEPMTFVIRIVGAISICTVSAAILVLINRWKSRKEMSDMLDPEHKKWHIVGPTYLPLSAALCGKWWVPTNVTPLNVPDLCLDRRLFCSACLKASDRMNIKELINNYKAAK